MYTYKNITLAAPTTTVCSSTPGELGKVIINKATANAVITIYDGTAATDTLIATITLPATLLKSQDVIEYGVATKKGVCVVTSTAACDLTIAYK